MDVAIVTLDGFNEIDSFVAAHILNRQPDTRALIVSPEEVVTSMNGVEVRRQRPMAFIGEADVVLFGSGRRTREPGFIDSVVEDCALGDNAQLIGSQCSGALILERLGFLQGRSASTDEVTGPFLAATCVSVVDGPFVASDNIGTAGGCLSAQYLAAWVLWRSFGRSEARRALSIVAPMGRADELTTSVLSTVHAGDPVGCPLV